MSLLIYELGQIVDRLLLVSPTEKRLHHRFEQIADDLTTNIGATQDLRFVSTRLEGGALKCWMAFDLGLRANLRMRIQLLGVSLEGPALPSRELVQANDALVLDWQPGQEEDDSFVQLPITQHNTEKPCLALLNCQPNSENDFEETLKDPLSRLRAKAQKKFFEETYQKFLVTQKPDDFLRQGLEWILSF